MKHVAPVETPLEVGCGEGHQTLALQKIAQTVVGVDVRPTAEARARANPTGRRRSHSGS
jgi:methylase of polypeptide subunit release factors